MKEILIMPPNLALLSTLNGSNYPYLELIFKVPKVFEPLKFDCITNYSLMCVLKSAKIHSCGIVTANPYQFIIVVKALALECLWCGIATVTPNIHSGAEGYQGNLFVWILDLQPLQLSIMKRHWNELQNS